MAVGSGDLGQLYTVDGIRMAAVSAGIKKPGRLDVVLFELCEGSQVAGVFTRNAFCAAPVQVAKQHIAVSPCQYLLVNTGNANAGTGQNGLLDAIACCENLARIADVKKESVLPFSTGVIGEKLPVEKISAVLPEVVDCLVDNAWENVARGIMTTDTRPKAVSRQIELAGKTITITGIAKGAGMIKPNMATMLGFVFTDLKLEQEQLQDLLESCSNLSFNRISVDGDTSTNDCCILAASGKSHVPYQSLTAKDRDSFIASLEAIFMQLAQGLVRDAEGASKFVTVQVKGGRNQAECLAVAYAIAESPLVKTALFASDPNWGRILAVVGRAGVPDLEIDAVSILLDDLCIVSNGGVDPAYTEAAGQAVMDQEEITITVNLDRGKSHEIIWTSDLSHDYVRINAEYRT